MPRSKSQVKRIQAQTQAPADEVLDLGAFGLGHQSLTHAEIIDLVLDQVRVPLSHKLYIKAAVEAASDAGLRGVTHGDVMRVYVPMIRALGGDIEPFTYDNAALDV